MKLTTRKVRWIIKQKDSGERTRVVAKVMDITPRRIQQIWKYYKDNNEEPVIGKNLGRPRKYHPEFEREIVREVKRKYKCGAVRLERLIEKIYNIHIPHNRIHMYLLDDNLAKEEPNKKRRRKWIRYERKHSMSAGHIDWCEKGINGTKVCAILDDSSRKILAGGEFGSANTENTKKVVDQMVKEYWDIRPLRELIMDHGSEFGAHRINEKGEWNSEFKDYLLHYGIKPILARVNHPQTNGKIEKWFDFYRRYRNEFDTFEEFIEWYNEIRPHGSLDLDNLETPAQAFWNRLPPECVLGIAYRLFGW
jgi:putative transposase